MFERQKTARPYAGRSGSSGSAASHERADAEDESGVTTYRQTRVLALLDRAGPLGMNWVEIGKAENWHHGQATGVLSVLHREGRIARLRFGRRDRSSIYVLPEHVEGRETDRQGRKPKVSVTEEHAVMASFLAAYETEKRARDAVVEGLQRDLEISHQNWATLAAETDAKATRIGELLDRVEVLRVELATAADEIDRLTKVDQAHRIGRTLRAPEEDEQDLLARLEERLAPVWERDDEDVLRVRLGTLRLITTILRRHWDQR